MQRFLRATSLTFALALVFGSFGCEDDGTASFRDSGLDRTILPDLGQLDISVDTNVDLMRNDGPDAALTDIGPDALPPPVLPRGRAWVRDNVMFVSGLTVNMGAPAASVVNDYFDSFHATAAHLWQNSLPTEVNGWKAANNAAFRYVAWTLPDGTSPTNSQLLGGYPKNAAGRIGYQIGDEPGDAQQISDVDDGVNAVRTHDPDALLIVNYAANVGDDILGQFCLHMDADVLSYDRYGYDRLQAYESLGRFRQTALSCDRPYWRYLTAYNPAEHHPDVRLMRWDAFTGLVFGYTGHSWFLYQVDAANTALTPALFTAKGDLASANRSSLWTAAAQINLELRNLGRVLTQLESKDIRYTSLLGTTYGGVRGWTAGAGNNPYITAIDSFGNNVLVGFFDDYRGEKVVVLQNAEQSDDEITITVSLDFSSDATINKDKVLTINKLTGQVEDKLLTVLGGSNTQLTVSLAGGEVFLFKVDNGVPFLLGK